MNQTILKLIVLLAICSPSLLNGGEHPHIVLIMADDMGYGDPTSYNANSKISTRHIDGLAADGMRFTDAHAPAALCVPTRYGLMTGRYPFRMPNVEDRHPLITADRMTIATLLRDNGYATHMVGKWHLGFDFADISGEHHGGPVDRGFDKYFGIPRSLDIPPYYYIQDRMPVSPPTETIAANDSVAEGWTRIQGAFWREGGIAPDFKHVDVLPRFADEAVQVIDQHAAAETGEPLFLYFALPAPHTPWMPTKEYIGKSGASTYGDFALQVDDCVGSVLSALEQHGMTDDTLVIFTSDNGPVWFPHDVERLGHASTGPLRGMKGDAWEGGHRMPFLVRWPGRVQKGTVSDQLICHVDLLRTFSEILGVQLPETEGVDSHSFLSELMRDGEPSSLRMSLISQSSKKVLAIRKGPWKLIPTRGSGGFTKTDEREDGPPGQLYRLDRDLGESNNLWNEHPEVVQELTNELKAIHDGHRTTPSS